MLWLFLFNRDRLRELIKASLIADERDKNERSSGRSCRLADWYVQVLFNKPHTWVTIVDHHGTLDADEWLAKNIKSRLEREHNIAGVNMRLSSRGRSLVYTERKTEIQLYLKTFR